MLVFASNLHPFVLAVSSVTFWYAFKFDLSVEKTFSTDKGPRLLARPFVSSHDSAAEVRFPEQRTQQHDPAPGDGQSGQAGQSDGLDRRNVRKADGTEEHDEQHHHHDQQGDPLAVGVGGRQKNLLQVDLHAFYLFLHITSALLSQIPPPGAALRSG